MAVLAAGIGLVVNATGALSQLERDSVDARFSIRGPERPRGDVVIVGIDQRTLDPAPIGLPVRWPYPRRYDAAVIRELKADGAKVIAFDVEFDQPTDVVDDNALVESIGQAGNVVLAANAIGPHGTTDVLGGGGILGQLHATAGYTIFPADSDGVVRRMYYEHRALLSFPVAAVLRATGRLPPRRDLLSDASAWIDYPGARGTVPEVSFADVYHGRVPAAAVAGKIVVVGATLPSLQDTHATSVGRGVSGPEIEADAISTALAGFPLEQASGAITVLLILLTAAAPALINARLAAGRALLLSLAPGAILLVAAQLLFSGAQLIVAVVSPLLALALSAFGSLGVNYVEEAFSRQATRLAFARFVPAAVVDEVLASTGPGVRLGGVRRIATVMFSDLRGFTSFSETLDPAVVISILNRYLTAMSDAILEHGGTLVAYMGDGIMAVFGAPLEYADHADRALAAATQMLASLQDFNVWLGAEHGFPPLRMGIGLNSGPVMSGNVGSERRLEYTALGDTTNTAARLEGMTKGTPHQLFIAQSTYEMLTTPRDDLVYVDELEVRGRNATVRIWSTADPTGDLYAAPPGSASAR